MPQFTSPTFPPATVFAEGTSKRQSLIDANVNTNVMVNRAIAQTTPALHVEDNGWEFLQNNAMIESCAAAPVRHYFTHFKLETYDGSSNLTHHMRRFTSSRYANSANITCY